VNDGPRKNAPKTRGKPFGPGNPGKPKGARHKATKAVEALLQGEAEALTRKAIESALEGDGVALRLCLDRIAPARRDNPVSFDLPKIERPSDAVAAHTAILAAVASGEMTPGEAVEVAKLIDGFVKTLEITEIDERLKRLEGRAGL
jgi:hypothetical protein